MKNCIDEPSNEMIADLITLFRNRKTQALIDTFNRRKTGSYESDQDFFKRIISGFMNFWYFTSGGVSIRCTFSVSGDFYNHYNYISCSVESKGLYDLNMLNRSEFILPLANGNYEAWRWSSAFTFSGKNELIKSNIRSGIVKYTTTNSLNWNGFVSVFDREKFLGDNFYNTLFILEKDITEAFEKGVQASLRPYSPIFSHLMHGRKIIRRKKIVTSSVMITKPEDLRTRSDLRG